MNGAAFEEAAPPETNVVGVRIWTTDGETKLFRDGDYPVLRGTALILDERNAVSVDERVRAAARHLYRTGDTQSAFYHPPAQQARHAQMETVLKDIVGLTKINYNSCNYNDSRPVTVRFAKMVGEVLTMGSAKGSEKQPFKFYV